MIGENINLTPPACRLNPIRKPIQLHWIHKIWTLSSLLFFQNCRANMKFPIEVYWNECSKQKRRTLKIITFLKQMCKTALAVPSVYCNRTLYIRLGVKLVNLRFVWLSKMNSSHIYINIGRINTHYPGIRFLLIYSRLLQWSLRANNIMLLLVLLGAQLENWVRKIAHYYTIIYTMLRYKIIILLYKRRI